MNSRNSRLAARRRPDRACPNLPVTSRFTVSAGLIEPPRTAAGGGELRLDLATAPYAMLESLSRRRSDLRGGHSQELQRRRGGRMISEFGGEVLDGRQVG